jgi:type I restriction enzyme S subunit
VTLAIKTGTVPADDISEGLPEGWALTTLQDACEINPPKASKDSLPADAPVTFVPMPAVDAEKGAITKPQVRRFSEVRKGFTSFRDGDVIMAKITPCMENGKSAIARNLTNGLGFGSTEFHVFRSTGVALLEFIYHYIRQESYRRAAEDEMTGSVGQKRVPQTFLEMTELPLPPLPEQIRIVRSLTELLNTLRASHDKLSRVPAILKRFRQAVLAAACSGRLTEDWREGNRRSLEENWREAELSDICTSISDGDHQPPPKQPTGVPFLTIGNVSSGSLDFSETRFVPERYFNQIKPERKPCRGDVLYTVVGATIGIPVLVDVDRPFCFQRHIALLRPSKETSPEFLWVLMSSAEVFKEAWSRVTGSAQPTLPLGNLRTIPINVPPLAEQTEIARRVQKLLKLADTIQEKVGHAVRRTEELTQSILAKAFRGELVPTEAELARREGREYEPASALLERIRAERTNQANTPPTQGERLRHAAKSRRSSTVGA